MLAMLPQLYGMMFWLILWLVFEQISRARGIVHKSIVMMRLRKLKVRLLIEKKKPL